MPTVTLPDALAAELAKLDELLEMNFVGDEEYASRRAALFAEHGVADSGSSGGGGGDIGGDPSSSASDFPADYAAGELGGGDGGGALEPDTNVNSHAAVEYAAAPPAAAAAAAAATAAAAAGGAADASWREATPHLSPTGDDSAAAAPPPSSALSLPRTRDTSWRDAADECKNVPARGAQIRAARRATRAGAVADYGGGGSGDADDDGQAAAAAAAAAAASAAGPARAAVFAAARATLKPREWPAPRPLGNGGGGGDGGAGGAVRPCAIAAPAGAAAERAREEAAAAAAAAAAWAEDELMWQLPLQTVRRAPVQVHGWCSPGCFDYLTSVEHAPAGLYSIFTNEWWDAFPTIGSSASSDVLEYAYKKFQRWRTAREARIEPGRLARLELCLGLRLLFDRYCLDAKMGICEADVAREAFQQRYVDHIQRLGGLPTGVPQATPPPPSAAAARDGTQQACFLCDEAERAPAAAGHGAAGAAAAAEGRQQKLSLFCERCAALPGAQQVADWASAASEQAVRQAEAVDSPGTTTHRSRNFFAPSRGPGALLHVVDTLSREEQAMGANDGVEEGEEAAKGGSGAATAAAATMTPLYHGTDLSAATVAHVRRPTVHAAASRSDGPDRVAPDDLAAGAPPFDVAELTGRFTRARQRHNQGA